MTGRGSWLSKKLDRISGLDAYTKPEKVDDALKLDSNENFALDREFISEIASQAAREVDLREYPLLEYDRLYAQLAKYVNIDEKYIAIGNGSDQIIELLLSTIGPGRRATVFSPTFSYFLNRCELHGIKVDKVPLRRDFTLNKPAFLKSAIKSDIIYLCSPNNPTGNQFDRQDMMEILDSLEGKLLLVDEAYADFADYSLAADATKYRGVVVLRTLSKAFGLAGARVGYMIANKGFTQTFRSNIQSPYPVSSLSLAIATNALARSDHVKKTIEIIRKERRRVLDKVSKVAGVKAFRSDANFIFIETGSSYDAISKALKDMKVIAKMLGNVAGHRGCIRVTIGTAEMNDTFLRCMQS